MPDVAVRDATTIASILHRHGTATGADAIEAALAATRCAAERCGWSLSSELWPAVREGLLLELRSIEITALRLQGRDAEADAATRNAHAEIYGKEPAP